jgi:shikimate kinase
VNIYLIGFMGSGKSSMGKRLASSLQWDFIDTDSLIEEQNGTSVEEIFALHGEKYFREAESKALRIVSARTHTVIACGGGTPCSKGNMAIMKETGVIVYLKMPVPALITRLLKSRNVRPLLKDKSESEMTAMVNEMISKRAQWYDQADIVAEGMSITAEELTDKLTAYSIREGGFLQD